MNEKLKAILLRTRDYLFPYIGGIVAAIVFTPVEHSLAGVELWFIYPIFAVPAFVLFSFAFQPLSLFSFDGLFLLFYAASLVTILFGVAAHFASLHHYRKLAPALVAFPLGFIGTVGVYFIAMSSI